MVTAGAKQLGRWLSLLSFDAKHSMECWKDAAPKCLMDERRQMLQL